MPDQPQTRIESLKDQVQHNTNQIQTNTGQIQQLQPGHIEISMVEYTFFGVIMLLGAGIIGWFIRNAFKSLTTSNTELKNSIEKLADVATSIHNDLTAYKVEVAETYVTKEALIELKNDIKDTCQLRHYRRSDDPTNPGI